MGNIRTSAIFNAIRSDTRVKRRQWMPDGNPTLICQDHSRYSNETTRIAIGASVLRAMIRIVVPNATANDRNGPIGKGVIREINRRFRDRCALVSEPDRHCGQRIQSDEEQSCQI